jgi:hypothetical protein
MSAQEIDCPHRVNGIDRKAPVRGIINSGGIQ